MAGHLLDVGFFSPARLADVLRQGHLGDPAALAGHAKHAGSPIHVVQAEQRDFSGP